MMRKPTRSTLQILSVFLALMFALRLSAIAQAAATTAPVSGNFPNATTQPSGAANDLTQLSLEDLMTVEVTSVAKEPQKIGNAPASVTVIEQDDIQRSGLGSIPELLRLVPGMDVAQISANQWAISTRGMNSYLADDLLVLMDGRSLYTPVFGGVGWNAVNYPLMDLDRIEAIRGPGSTLWGANAVNGVVDIITKSSKDTQGVLVDARGGTQLDIGNIRYGGEIDDKTFYRVYSQYQYNGNSDQANGDPAHDEWQGMQSGFRLDRYASPTDTLTVQGDIYEQQLNETTTPLPVSVDTRYYANGGDLLGRWTHTESDRADTSLQAYYDRQDVSNEPIGYQQDTLDIQFQNRFPLGEAQDITWGLGARDYFVNLAPRPPVTASPIYTNQFIYNGFLQDQVTIVPHRLQWYLGTKLEYNSLTQSEVEPGTRLLWTPDDHNSLWASASRSVRIASIYQNTHIDIGVANLGSQNPDAEKSNSFEVGYKVQPIKPLTLDVTGFYNMYSDLIVLIPNLANPTEVDSANAAEARSYGSEISANWQVTPQCRLGASYSYLMTRGQPVIKTPADFFIPEYELQFISASSPKNQFQVHCYLDLLKNLQWNTSLYYVDALPFINATSTSSNFQSVSSYFRLDMNLRWQVKPNMTLAVGVQNLLQDRHFEFGSINAQQEPTAVPRTFFAEWTMTF
jgi:iron complex outermembrane receptor protein